MRVNGKAILGLVALGVALSSTDASAVTRCANPAGTAPCLKLQAAIDASGPGDTVTINSGTYAGTALDPYGYAFVDYGKDGLKLNGVGSVVIDTEFTTGNVSSNAIEIYSPFVTVSNLTIRNGDTGIYADYANGLIITNVKVLGANDDCFYLYYTDYPTVKGSKCIGVGGSGIYSDYSDFITATGNSFSQVYYGIEHYYGHNPNYTSNSFLEFYEDGIYMYGDSSNYGAGGTVKSNTMLNGDYDGVYIEYYNGANVTSNKITNVYYSGVYVYGEAPTITLNNINAPYEEGILVYGNAAQIKTNTINGAYYEGIYVDSGYGDSDSAYITGNKITGYPDYNGIEVYSYQSTISNNTVTNAYTGIYVDDGYPRIISNTTTNTHEAGVNVTANTCYGGLIQLNKVNNALDGYDGFNIECFGAQGILSVLSNTVNRANGDCFSISANTAEATSVNAVGNKAYDCGAYGNNDAYGFYLSSNGNVASGIKLSQNLAQRVVKDGYHVAAINAELTANTADSASEDGFDVHARGVKLVNNKATNNAAIGFELNWADDPRGVTCNGNTTLCPNDGATLTITGNTATGNALGACTASTMTNPLSPATLASTNSFGTPANPAQCNTAEGYIGN